MFKELFSTTNKQINKDRGIAGIINTPGAITSGGSSVDGEADDLPHSSNGGRKLISDRKNIELQEKAQEK